MKRKKTIRNIIIVCVVVVLIVAAVVLTIMLRKDGHNMNAFERARTAASANGETVTMQEFAMMFDTLVQTYSYSSLTDEQLKTLQENAASQALMQKIYTKEAKALGLTLTDEEQAAAKTSAQEQIDAIVENYTQQLVSSGTFTKAALDKQVANYYAMLGMNQSQYFAYCKERYEASAYADKLDAYYEEHGTGFTEEEILAEYHEEVEPLMETYSAGQYSMYMMYYAYGYMTPLLYVPEGFFYIDLVQVSKDSEEEINELFAKVDNGEMTFEELMESDENVFLYRSLEAPYAIGDDDYNYVFTDAEAYEAAKALEIGQTGTYIMPVTQKDDDGNETVASYTGYLFRRVEGTMCEEGQSGIIKIDYYPQIRESVESTMLQEKWLSDVAYNDAMYTYRGSL